MLQRAKLDQVVWKWYQLSCSQAICRCVPVMLLLHDFELLAALLHAEARHFVYITHNACIIHNDMEACCMACSEVVLSMQAVGALWFMVQSWVHDPDDSSALRWLTHIPAVVVGNRPICLQPLARS